LKLNIKSCRNLDSLLDALNKFTESIAEFKTKEKLSRDDINKKSRSGDSYYPEVSLGPLDHFFFHLVLDNVKSLFKIERQKKILEKLAIA
jgi:hypothetical protein